MAFYNEQQQLAELKRAWEKDHPRSAAGGRLALSGFHYQFLSVLLESVRRWKRARDEHHRDAGAGVFTETLSDMVTAEDGAIIVTQVKRSLTRGDKVKSALRDLWSIHTTAQHKTPDLLPKLQYRIQAARGDLDKIAVAIRDWAPAPSDADEDGDPEQTKAFLDKVRAEIRVDPEEELLTLLANEPFRDRDPLARIRDWLGRLIEAADGGTEGYENVAKEIWSNLQSLRDTTEQRPPGIYFWDATDRPPDTITEGDVLRGRRPQAHHLKEGFFAPRALYPKLVERVTDWALGDGEEPDATVRLRLFWIGGRSGCGKSVALLHVLAGLHEQGFGPILWLANQPKLLPDAVRWCRNFQGPERQPLIALDDPYAPNVQENDALWDDALKELQDLRQQGNGEALPLIVCCGPTEQAEQLEENKEEHLRLERVDLPREEPEEIQLLRGWYRTRTGKEPPPFQQDADVLLVQLFFEWQAGEPIGEFAKRLRNRIHASDPDGLMEKRLSYVLSLNRLYAGYPRAALDIRLDTGGLRWLWDQLREEQHIAEYDDADRQGVRITHPHLANAIYESWYSLTKGQTKKHRHERAEHLKVALRDALDHGETPGERTAPLWSLSFALAPDDGPSGEEAYRMRGRVDGEETRKLLRDLHGERAQDTDKPMRLFELPVWIQLAAQVPELQLRPDPIDTAIDRIKDADTQEQGLRLTCHKLLQYREGLDEARQGRIDEAVIGLLRRAPEWHEWRPVAMDALWRTGQAEVTKMIADWVPRYATPAYAGAMLFQALRIAPDDKSLLDTAETLLPNAPASFDWGDIALRLLKRAETPPNAVQEWTERNYRQVESCFVLGELLRRGHAAAIPWGKDWARLWHRERAANFVLEPLWDRGVSPETLRPWCVIWVENCPAKANPSFLIEKLIHAFPEDRKVTITARRWLAEAPPEHESWAFVWQALRKANPDDTELDGIARRWLANAPPKHGSWKFVWEALHKTSPDDQELNGIARRWLAEAPPEHESWAFVWQALRKANPDDPELDRIARRWLAEAPPEHGSWQFVWQALRKANPDDTELDGIARRWLAEAPPEHGSWWYVWEALRKANPDDPELDRIARRWLAEAPPEHGSWQFVWQALRKANPDDTELDGIARRWLAEAPPEHGSWWYVWEALRKANPGDPELDSIARQWLTEALPEHESWAFVWQALHDANPGDPELGSIGRQWLTEAPPEHGSWWYVWEALRKTNPGDPELDGLARQWLAEAPPEHGSWWYVWEALRKANPGDPELDSIARHWLAEAPPEHGSWKFVWEALYKANPDDPELGSIARRWLTEAPPEHGSWWYVWEALRKTNPDDPELGSIARQWLAEAPPEHKSWAFVWQALYKANPDDPELGSIARRWLAEAPPEHGSWQYVWQALRKANPGDPELDRIARRWLAEAPPEHGSWTFVWEALMETYPDDADLYRQGRRFLEEMPDTHGSWPYIWRACRQITPEDGALEEMGLRWLAETIGHRSWIKAFNPLWDDNRQRDRLRMLARARLSAQPDGKGADRLREILEASGHPTKA